MDGTAFDRLARRIGVRMSRREAMAAALAAPAAGQTLRDAAAKKKKKVFVI